jgi:DNA replication protein DnaC
MSLDGKLLSRAKNRLDAMRNADEREMQERRQRAYRKNPHIMEIDNEIKSTVIDAIGVALRSGGDPVDAVEKIKDRNLGLQEERALALTAAGFPPDYLSESYRCSKCHDTGYNGTEICSCLMELYKDEQRKELSELLKLGVETFDNFNLDYYSTEVDARTGISPRDSMEIVFETCREYARTFSKKSMNLFLSGGTGLGKTFLSTCIARVVSERGFSVVYDTASSIFSKYEQEKFSKNTDDVDRARADIKRLETCDLLIVDDLGTEMPTSFVTSALYTLINTRLMNDRKMVISSNIPMSDLGRRYSAPIMSRLEGEFLVLNFYGRDIRLIKNGL